MRGFRIFGEYLFEYFVITLLLILSIVLVLPFVPMYVGIISYFTHKRNDRMLKDIFITIKENLGIIIKFTILEVIILVVSLLNIYFFMGNWEGFNIVILVLSYIALFVGIVFLAHAPMIIIGMRLNLRQLIFNCVLFFFGGLINSLISILAIAGLIVLASYYPHLAVLAVYFVPLIVSYFTLKSFRVFKAKKLNISVHELIEKENKDIYFEDPKI